MSGPDPWQDAVDACALFAIDPGLGMVLRTGPGPLRDGLVARLQMLLPAVALRPMPAGITEDRLTGGLDLSATLAAGRPISARGFFDGAAGSVVLARTAERLPAATAAMLAAKLDESRITVVALDEGLQDEAPPASLTDRLALRPYLPINLRPASPSSVPDPELIAAARARLPEVMLPDAVLTALAEAALALGIDSLRGLLQAARAARAAAAWHAAPEVGEAAAAVALRLVLAPRATRLPSAEPPTPGPPPEEPARTAEPRSDSDGGAPDDLADTLIQAAATSLPPDILAALAEGAVARRRGERARASGRQAATSGRPAGLRHGNPKAGARLAILATLRAAAPWQRLRPPPPPGQRLALRREDFRVVRRVASTRTTTIVAVDASGSAALHRLAEAKGAVELLLASCYVRRDRVALIAFRGRGAEVRLPPTTALARARRSLAGLPGGGGTPLAAALDTVRGLAGQVRRTEGRPVLALLTDGGANVTRAGVVDRQTAMQEALAAAGALRADEMTAVLIDTAPRPQASARLLAEAMGARYLPLPQANAAAMASAMAKAGAS